MMVISNKWAVGDIVYLKTDEEAKPRLVYQILVTKRELLYGLCSGTTTSDHFDFEITTEKPVFI